MAGKGAVPPGAADASRTRSDDEKAEFDDHTESCHVRFALKPLKKNCKKAEDKEQRQVPDITDAYFKAGSGSLKRGQ